MKPESVKASALLSVLISIAVIGLPPSIAQEGESVWAKARVEKVLLGAAHPDILGATYSDDGRHLAYVRAEDGQMRVYRDAKAGSLFERIGPKSLVFSRCGKSLAYAATIKREAFVIRDAKAEGPYQGLALPKFSPDGSSLGYIALRDGKQMVVINGKESKGYDAIADSAPCFSPDGKHHGFAALENGRWTLVIDGKEQQTYDAIGKDCPVFSPDGKRRACFAIDKGKKMLLLDGKVFPAYEGSAKDTLTFSPDSRVFACFVRRDNRSHLFVNGVLKASYEQSTSVPISFSPDSKRMAFDIIKGKEWYVVEGETTYGPFDSLSDRLFGPNSKRFAFAARKGDRWFVAEGKQSHPPHMALGKGSFVFSPAGNRLAYAAHDEEGWTVVVDGKPGAVFSEVDRPAFSPDGKHVTYRGEKADITWHPVVDDWVGPPYTIIMRPGPTFNPDGSLEYLAIDDRKLWRVKHTPRR